MASRPPRFDRFYSAFAKRLALPTGDFLAGQRIMNFYRFYNESQWWDRDRLEEWQNSALARTISVAYNETAFYRDLYDSVGAHPSDVKTLADLGQLPVVTKDMIRDAYPTRCVIDSGLKWQEFHTSGSTGKPLVVRMDRDTLSRARALMLLRAEFSGWEIGEGLLQTGMSLNRGTLRRLKDRWLRTFYVSAFDLSDSVLDRYLAVIEKRKIRYVMGYAASLYLIAKRARDIGFTQSLDGLVSWGDNLFPHYRALIESQFGCRVTDTYGCGEGLQVAAQCESANGSYHLFMPHVAVEFVNNGRRVPDGELGEVLLTRLDPGAMPLIRYQVGDIGRSDPRRTCDCGRGLALMKSIDGRSTDIVTTPNGNRLIVHFFTGIFEYAKSIDTFQVIQDRPDRIIIRIVAKGQLDTEEWGRLEREIKSKGGADLGIDLEVVEDIPLAHSNKRRFVISNLENHA